MDLLSILSTLSHEIPNIYTTKKEQKKRKEKKSESEETREKYIFAYYLCVGYKCAFFYLLCFAIFPSPFLPFFPFLFSGDVEKESYT